MKSAILNITINRDSKDVYNFVSDLQNLPKWAKTFFLYIKKEGDKWQAITLLGEVKITMTPQNAFGILDHFIYPKPDVEIYVPMRVVANGKGSEVIFTLFREPDMSDSQFVQDQKWVREDLETLKKVMEEG